MPAPNPIMASPIIMNAGELYIPIILDVPTKNIPSAISRYPRIITVVFLNFSVKMYIRGVVEAYISVGTAKVKPINTGV